MKKKYSKLRKLLQDSTISTHPGEVVIRTDNRETLFTLLNEVALEQDEK